MDTKTSPKIAVIGGTGFYSFLDNPKTISIDTPYGKPSTDIVIGQVNQSEVVFIARHGKDHSLMPHKIPYLANIWALHSLNVKFILAGAAAGSLQGEIKPGDFVIPNQFVDRTRSRNDTFYEAGPVTHMPGTDPFCDYLMQLAQENLKSHNLSFHQDKTAVIIQGPRFSTVAESQWFSKMGWDIINMTLYPECILARELEISYLPVCLITDYDSGLQGQFETVTVSKAVDLFKRNVETMKSLFLSIISSININYTTTSHSALSLARF
ncbi:S-methyl-5'-thioadenosine phosphorylase [Candidatus Marinamargulisbacteria bacterium SCGC AG-410-N11]|nr:S-methyl-5'-thioadenosine phosphorylase [Candidatus Marinamargulisbacteria bacterium SCGC AG-410-N11]